jgi:hypothetical protein
LAKRRDRKEGGKETEKEGEGERKRETVWHRDTLLV